MGGWRDQDDVRKAGLMAGLARPMVAATGADSSCVGDVRAGMGPMAARETIGEFPRTGCVSGQARCARMSAVRGQTPPATMVAL